MTRNLKLHIVIIILFFISCTIYAGLNEARELNTSGKSTEGLLEYEKWLGENIDSPNLTSVLFEITEIKGDIRKISLVLENYIQYVTKREDKKLLFVQLSMFYEITGNIQQAQKNWQNASLIIFDRIDYSLLINSSKLLILQGELLTARLQLEEILLNSTDSHISEHAAILLSLVNKLESGEDQKSGLVELDDPSVIYLNYILAGIDPVKSSSIIKKLSADYSLSPETFLMDGNISAIPDIVSSLGLLNSLDSSSINIKTDPDANRNVDYAEPVPEVVSIDYIIQAGSFRDPENAQYLSADINREGLVSIVEEQIINGISYHKVLLYFTKEKEMKKALDLLKSKGYEGFPIY